MNQRLQAFKYLLSDALAAALAYFAVFTFRKLVIESRVFGDTLIIYDQKFVLSLIAIVLFWLSLYAIIGSYRTPYRRSRLKEFT